jgi:hypothetical protein
MKASAQQVTVKVDPTKQFNITLTAEQIVLALDVLREATFRGAQAELAASLINSIQDPVLLEAHTVEPQ